MRLALLAVLALAPLAAQAQPESRGPHPIADYDAGRLSLAGAMIPVHVYLPSDVTTPMPVVAVVHGFLRNGSFMAELARTLASRGMVALVPDMPCGLSGCDHDANAAQIRALIAWGISESGVANSALSGRVDPTRRGAIGHSWGALATILASTQPDGFDVAVLLDPNDDRGVAAMRAGMVTKPTLLLQAEVLGNCNNAWGGGIFATIPTPHLRVRVRGSAHCDAEEPSDNLCPIGCGRGDPSKSVVFRRYAVAFVACALQGDTAVAPWVDGPMLAMDDMGGVVDMVSASGLQALACKSGGVPPLPDAGPGPSDDASTTPGGDDATTPPGDDATTTPDASTTADEDAATSSGEDARTTSGLDASAATADAGSGAATDAAGGKPLDQVADGCQTVRAHDPLPLLLIAGGALAYRRRRRAL